MDDFVCRDCLDGEYHDECVNEDYDDEEPVPPVYDNTGVHVMAEQCSTCIFRPGNLMQLNKGGLKGMVEDCNREDVNVICHQTLGRDVGAICRGSFDLRPGQMTQIAERIGLLHFDGAGDK